MEKPQFKVGDELFIDHEYLKDHILVITEIQDDGRIYTHHSTVNWHGNITSFSNIYLHNPRLVTPLDKLL